MDDEKKGNGRKSKILLFVAFVVCFAGVFVAMYL